MLKTAEILTKLQPHQAAALKRALKNNLILAHSTGSGKTLTSIAIADALGKPTTVLTPASLVENFKKELTKHKKGGPSVDVLSLPTAVSRGYQIPEGNTLIIDEAHSLRNSGTARQQYIKDQLSRAGRIFALTGTPAYNQITDWAPLVNIVAKQHIIPEDSGSFRKKYIKETVVTPSWYDRVFHGVKPGVVESLKNGEDLKRRISPYVDVFDVDIEKPRRIDQDIHVQMSPDQQDIYRTVMNKMPRGLAAKIKKNMPPSKTEAQQLNAFLSGVRQVSNTPEGYSVGAETGEKIKEAVRNLVKAVKENRDMRALVYSNYLESGVDSYAKRLDDAGVPYGKYTGALTQKQKKELVDQFNSGKLPVLLASGSGSEGLDLKGTRLIQILEPHWNDSRIDQVIGRGIRYKSHSHLPKDQQNVTVQRYFSDLPSSGWLSSTKNTSVDNYLAARAKEKADLINQVKKIFT